MYFRAWVSVLKLLIVYTTNEQISKCMADECQAFYCWRKKLQYTIEESWDEICVV